MKREPLTCRQQEVLHYVREFIERNGYPPSFSDIGEHFNFTASGALYYLGVLERKGYIERKLKSPRCLVVPERRVYRLKHSMPTEGLKKNDAVVVLCGARWLEGKCVLRDGDEIVGVVTGFTRRL